jgi:hypothetical protein
MIDVDETIKDILEINLKVKTDSGKERYISFLNFKKPKCPSVDVYSDKSVENLNKQIKINMDCDSFDLYITENDGWIPVGERLPENDYEVLITYWTRKTILINMLALHLVEKHILVERV